MPRRDTTGPPRNANGPRDGSGGGSGRAPGRGSGSQTGGKKRVVRKKRRTIQK